MPDQSFGGAFKKGQSLLGPIEKRFVNRWVGTIPKRLETYHLTMMTILWSALVILSAWQAQKAGYIIWFWGVSIAIFLQYLTDLFDGAVGRERNTGLVKWGFYMDHFLDFIFQCALIVAYALISPPELNLQWWFFAILAITQRFYGKFISFIRSNQ